MQIKSRAVEDRVEQLLSVGASILHSSKGDSTLRTGGVTMSGGGDFRGGGKGGGSGFGFFFSKSRTRSAQPALPVRRGHQGRSQCFLFCLNVVITDSPLL